jgi:hypothetical protein
MTRPLVKETSSRTCVAKFHPERCTAGLMYWVQISRSVSFFLSNTRETLWPVMMALVAQHTTPASPGREGEVPAFTAKLVLLACYFLGSDAERN